MSNTGVARLTKFAGLTPAMGTYPLAANTFIPKGTLVTINSSGYAVGDGSGVRCVGVAAASANNLTGNPDSSGLADASAAKVSTNYGIHEFVCADADVLPGDIMYALDNQTVTKDPVAGGCVVGTYHESGSDGKKYVNVSTLVPAVMGSLQQGRIDVPLGSLRLAAGTTIAAFAAGSADGIEINEGVHVRWNDDVFTTFWADVDLPPDLDDSRDIVVSMLASRVGSADTTAVITVGAFILSAGDAVAADSDAGGASTAVSAATTITQEITRTIAAADVPAGARKLSLSLVPSAALDDDDLRLHSLAVLFTRKG